MTPTRLLSLVVLTALAAACDQPSVTAPNEAPAPLDAPSNMIVPVARNASSLAPSYSAQANPTASWSDEPVILDFESLATERLIAAVGYTYQEDGYEFAVSGDGVFSTYGSTNASYAGSTGLFLNDIQSLDVILTSEDGTLFSAESIDLAPAIDWAPRAEVTLIGTRADGSTVTQSLTTSDRVFRTFELEGFTSLVELRWTQQFSGFALHQFDNVVLTDARAESRAGCFNGGWKLYGFRNQGECMRILEAGPKSQGRG